MFKVDLEKAEEPEIKLPTFVGSSQKQESSRKHLLYWLHQSLWLCWSQQTVEKSSRVRNTRPPYLPPEKSVFLCLTQVKKWQLEPDMEQLTSSRLGKEYIRAVYCHPVYLTYMQSTSWEMPDWMKHRLESRFLGEISTTSVKQMTPPLWQKVKRN